MWAAPNDRRRARRRRRPRIERLQRADRRQHHRQPQSAAHHLHRCVDLADIAQHARPECDLVERHAVAPQGSFGFGATDDIVPGIWLRLARALATSS